MNRTFVCDVSKENLEELLDVFEMKSALESLIMQIAGNNDILKEDSLLYSRLVEDYKKCMEKYSKAWQPYLEQYGHLLDNGSEFTIDYKSSKLYIVSTGQEQIAKV